MMVVIWWNFPLLSYLSSPLAPSSLVTISITLDVELSFDNSSLALLQSLVYSNMQPFFYQTSMMSFSWMHSLVVWPRSFVKEVVFYLISFGRFLNKEWVSNVDLPKFYDGILLVYLLLRSV